LARSLHKESDPDLLQERISQTLFSEFPQKDVREIVKLVQGTYQKLSDQAKVTQHIPALVEGKIRRMLKHQAYLDA